ncbi:MAG: tetratricopeptide repeat protein [Thermoplasmata archaeon]
MKQRIQLHLFDFQRFSDAYEAPLAVTQEGIARAVGINVHHVTQYVRPLLDEEVVQERTSHIREGRRRRKVYFLTPRGRNLAASLRNTLLETEVPFQSRKGEVREMPLSQLYQEHRRGTSLCALLLELKALGHVPEEADTEKPGIVDFSREAPAVAPFYGREEEVAQVLEAVNRASVVVITGMAGIGKTALGSKVCEASRGERSLFWRQIRPWDGAMDLALRVARFLNSLGRVGVQSALLGSGREALSRIEELLQEDLAGIEALLVFDDVHEATEDASSFLAILLRVLKAQEGTCALLLSRDVPRFYSRREVDLEGVVVELPLRGLDVEASRSLLAEAGMPEPLLGPFINAGGGNPLFLRLLSKATSPGAPKERSVETFIAEEIEPGLTRSERRCLEVTSFYQIPVPGSGLLLEKGARRSTLVTLGKKGLLDRVRSDRLVLHDTLRSYFGKGVARERAEEIVEKVVPWLRETAHELAEGGRPEQGIAYLQNAVAIDADPSRLVSSLEALGRLRRFVGDYPDAMEAYRLALPKAGDREVQARLHRKIALCQANQGNLDEAEREIDAGFALLPPGPSPEAAWLHQQRGAIAYARQDFDRSLETTERVFGWLPSLPDDPNLRGFLLNLRALVFLDDPSRDDPTLAERDLKEAVEAFEKVGNQRGLANAYNNLGIACLESDRYEEALVHLDRAAAIAKEAGDLAMQATPLFTKAFALMDVTGDYEAAEATYQQTYKLCKETYQGQKVVLHYLHFAQLYRRQGRFQEARESLEYFLQQSGDTTSREYRAQDLGLMVRLCVLCGDTDAAEKYFEEAFALVEAVHSEQAEQALNWAKGTLLAFQGDTEGALESYRRASKATADPHLRGELMLEYGQLLKSAGEWEEAREVLLTACEDLEHGSKALEGMAREELKALEAHP